MKKLILESGSGFVSTIFSFEGSTLKEVGSDIDVLCWNPHNGGGCFLQQEGSLSTSLVFLIPADGKFYNSTESD